MKVMVNIPENKMDIFLDFIKSLHIKAVPVFSEKRNLKNEIQEAVHEMQLIRAGKKKARNAEDFLNEL